MQPKYCLFYAHRQVIYFYYNNVTTVIIKAEKVNKAIDTVVKPENTKIIWKFMI